MKLQGYLRTVESLGKEEISSMFELMQEYYENVSWNEFIADLQEKDWVIQLRNSDMICGFSTQKLYEELVSGEKTLVVFSGDTIIRKEFWGTTALPIAFGRMMLEIKKQHQDKELYWFLTSKGFRTYRFLPVFFKEFYPRYNSDVPLLEHKLISILAQKIYPERLDIKNFIIKAKSGSQRLKPGVGDISINRCKDPHIAFFAEANPDYLNGDELACIARFDEHNLTKFILNRLRINQQEVKK